MSTVLTAFRTEVYKEVKGVLNETMDLEILWAVTEFCRKTWLWSILLSAQNIEDGTADYTLVQPASSNIVAVDTVIVDGSIISPTSEQDLDLNDKTWRDKTSTSPSRYFMNPDRVLTLVYTPSEDIDSGLQAKVILEPTKTSTYAEDFIYNDYADIIGFGAKYRLQMMKNMPWANIEGAALNRQLFYKGISEAKSRRFFGHTGMQPKLQRRRFM